MSRALARAAVATLILSASLLGVAAAPGGAQEDPATTAAPKTTGPPDTPSGDPAIDDLVGCIQGSRRLLVLFLIDESASLKQSDPEDRRVDAARGALDSLVALAGTDGEGSPQVDVALAAFSNEYREVQGWTEASADTAGSLDESLDQFADFNDGIDTDLVNALTAGRESLADRSAEITADNGEAPCRAIMLFTDGGYDIAVRASKEDQERLGIDKPYAPGIELTNKENVEDAERLGRKELCDPGKLADQIRSDDITLLTVALSGDVARRTQVPLAAATTGIADDYPCGTQPKKGQETRPQGAYLPAEDIDVLVSQFNGVGARLAGGNLVPGEDQVKICGEDACPEGSRSLSLDQTLRRAQILTLAPKAGTEVLLTSPSGETARVSEAGTSKIGATEISARLIAGRGFAIDLDRPEALDSWTGKWTVSIVDPSGDQVGDSATLQLYVFSDIGVEFGDMNQLERGKPTEVVAVLRVPKGVNAAESVETATAQARFRNPSTGDTITVDLQGPPEGPFTGTLETPASVTANALTATAEVRITTATDAVLVSQSAPEELLVRRPEGSIQFVPGSLEMPSLTGTGTTEAQLVLVGGSADGCVWFGEASVPDEPEGAGTITVTQGGSALPGESSCIKVPAGESLTIPIEAAPDGRASGTVQGDLVVFEKVEGAAEASRTDVAFRFDMARGIDQARRLLLAALLILGGLALPLVALLVINALTARFQQLDAVRASALPVRVSGRSISRTDGSFDRPFTLRDSDFGSLASAGSDRRFTFGGVEFRARASRNPFGAMRAMAEPEGGAERLKGRAGSQVELDAGLAGSWVFLLDPDKTRAAVREEAEGLLISFVAEGAIDPQTDRLIPDIENRLPDTAANLAGLVRESTPKRKQKTPKATPAANGGAAPHAPEAPAPPSPPGASGSEVIELPPPAPEAGAEAEREVIELPAPADAPSGVPMGFGGTATIDPRLADPPSSEAGDGDDDPAPPPLGFGGTSS